MNKSFKYLPQGKRKKILLICDDIRVHSGVATVAREIVLNTAQHFHHVKLAPDTRRYITASKASLQTSSKQRCQLPPNNR